MTSQRVSRGQHLSEAARILPGRRGERACSVGSHDTAGLRHGEACPNCGAVK